MISKSKLKELAGYRLQKRCDEETVFVAEGPRLAAEVLTTCREAVRTVCATAAWLQANGMQERMGMQGDSSAFPVYEVSQAELERLSHMKSPNQVWMLVERRDWGVTGGELVLALDCIQDPGNMGTLLRTADWFGIRRVVCSTDTVSCYNPKVVQASMGAVLRTHVEYCNLPQWLAGCGMTVCGASLQGRPLPECDKPQGKAVLLIGNEGRGISAEAMEQVTMPVLIPNIGGTAESLNASVAAGILMHWLATR